jgi:hypothetical protein
MRVQHTSGLNCPGAELSTAAGLKPRFDVMTSERAKRRSPHRSGRCTSRFMTCVMRSGY